MFHNQWADNKPKISQCLSFVEQDNEQRVKANDDFDFLICLCLFMDLPFCKCFMRRATQWPDYNQAVSLETFFFL